MSSTTEPQEHEPGESLEQYLDRQCKRYALPHGYGTAGQLAMLLRHIMNNNAAIIGMKDYSIRQLES